MRYIGSIYILWITWTMTNGQFFYNYEEEQPHNEQPETYDSTDYKYNSPSAVEQYYPQSHQSPPLVEEPAPARYRSRQNLHQSRPESRGYREEPEVVDIEYQSAPEADDESEYVQDVPRSYTRNQQRRRTSRRRHSRVRQRMQEEVIEAPKYYSPSVFENIGLGEAPDGIYVPNDSLLNSLRSNPRRETQPRQVNPVQHTSEQNTVEVNPQYSVQPVRNHQSDVSPFLGQSLVQQYETNQQSQPQQSQLPQQPHREPESRFFVQSPPQRELPVARVQPEQYQPSTQEIQQNEYRRQKRVNQVAQQLPVRRNYREPQPSSSHRAPQPQNRQKPVRPVYTAEPTQDYSEDQRQSSVRRFEEAPRKRQRIQEPVTSAPKLRERATFRPARLAIAELPDDSDGDGIPGGAGIDYPILHSIPTTSFSCSQQPHNGYYADLETSCQVVHLCQSGGNKDSFLCPNGTIFSQEKFACQWWYKVNCQNSPRYYSINDSLYKVPGDTKKK